MTFGAYERPEEFAAVPWAFAAGDDGGAEESAPLAAGEEVVLLAAEEHDHGSEPDLEDGAWDAAEANEPQPQVTPPLP